MNLEIYFTFEINMSKLYTKTGDKGITSLYDRRRVSKSNFIIDFLGDLDELSAHVGLLCVAVGDESCNKNLRRIQSKLLDIGSSIATTKKEKRTTDIDAEEVKRIEGWIDDCQQETKDLRKELREFVLPGVTVADAQAHVCRAVARRAERKLCKINEDEQLNQNGPYVNSNILQYMNRLSDYFFALSRELSGYRETKRSEFV